MYYIITFVIAYTMGMLTLALLVGGSESSRDTAAFARIKRSHKRQMDYFKPAEDAMTKFEQEHKKYVASAERLRKAAMGMPHMEG